MRGIWYPIVHMNKIMKILITLVVALMVSVGIIQANEGNVVLTGTDVSCEGVSLWKGNSYRVVGRCEGLVYPYATQLEHYVLWAKAIDKSEIVRVGEVERGYWDGSVKDSYTDLYLTAESNGLPRRPSETQVASGVVSGFGFSDSEAVTAPIATPAPLAEENDESMTVQNEVDKKIISNSTAGDVIGKIVRSLLVIVAVVIVIVIGTSLVFRRRGSVST